MLHREPGWRQWGKGSGTQARSMTELTLADFGYHKKEK